MNRSKFLDYLHNAITEACVNSFRAARWSEVSRLYSREWKKHSEGEKLIDAIAADPRFNVLRELEGSFIITKKAADSLLSERPVRTENDWRDLIDRTC